jgi:hypothetical protein
MSYPSPNVIASGTTFAQFQAGGASGHLERLITANATAEANPTVAATFTSTGGGSSGGALAAGTYLANFTETNGFGETLPSAESTSFTVAQQPNPSHTTTGAASGSSGSLPAGTYFFSYTYVDSAGGETTAGTSEVATHVTVSATNTLTITFNDTSLPAFASGRNVYLTATGGLSGSETLYATGVTTSTYIANSASWTNGTTTQAAAVVVPTTNTTSTQIPQATFPTLKTGNSARNLYLTAAGASTGTEVLYARGITTTTFSLSSTAPGTNYSVALPTANTTGFDLRAYELLRSAKYGNFEDVYRRLRMLVYDFNHGSPVPHPDLLSRLQHVAFIFAMFHQLCIEIGTLIDANPGHINPVINTIGNAANKRTWP